MVKGREHRALSGSIIVHLSVQLFHGSDKNIFSLANNTHKTHYKYSLNIVVIVARFYSAS